MRNTHVKSEKMKKLHITLIVLFSIVLTSCEQLGIEVTTVKGIWQTEKTEDQYLILAISDFGLAHGYLYKNDSISSRGNRTWSLHNDTLSFYHQDFNADGIRQFKIEQMSMNTLTIRHLKSNNVWIMSRLYSNVNNDYDSHFNEVFDLKKGFWWYTWKITCFVLGGLILIGLIMGLFNGSRELIKWIRKKSNK